MASDGHDVSARYEAIATSYEREAVTQDSLAVENRRWATASDDAMRKARGEELAQRHERRAAELRERARQARTHARDASDGPLQRADGLDLHNHGELRFADVRHGRDRDSRDARAAFGFGRGRAAERAFTTTNDPGDGVYYRVTDRGGDGARPWCFTEEQFAQFTTDGRFDHDKWRSWAAVRPKWQLEAHEVHVIHVDRDRPFVAHSGLTAAQDQEPGSKVAYMGSARQTYLEQANVKRIETWSTESPRLQQQVRELAARQPDAGKLVGRRAAPDAPSPGGGSDRERRKRAIEERARGETKVGAVRPPPKRS